MNEMKRVLALLLCVVMLVGVLPVGALAADVEATDPVVVLDPQAAGAEAVAGEIAAPAETEDPYGLETAEEDPVNEQDEIDYLFVATDRHADTSVIGNLINKMETVIGENELDYLALGGDMVGSANTHPSYNSSTVLAEVTGATSSLDADNVDIVAGIHDMNVTDDTTPGIVLPYQGGGAEIYEGENFYVYGVEEYCISDKSNESNWSTQAQKFVDWANGSDIDTSKVIIVVSHYPLHANRNDNDGAYYWHTALNKVATNGGSSVVRDIVFFHGHNHTVDSEEYVYEVGDYLTVQNGSSTATEAIKYTYATAGYLNQNKKATLVTITDDTITLTKYTTSSSSAMTTVTRVAEAEPEATLTGIRAESNKDHVIGDELDITVYAVYSDNSEKEITDYTVTGFDRDVAGPQNLFISWGDYSTTLSLTVTDPSAEPTVQDLRVEYPSEHILLGTELTLTVTAVYSDSNEVVLSAEDYTVEGYDKTKAGTQGIVVSYGEQSVGFNVTVWINDETTGTYVTSDNVTAMTVTDKSDDETIAGALAGFLHQGFVAYDIVPENYVDGTEAKAVLPIPEGVTNPVVYYVSEDGKTVADMKATVEGDKVVFTTDHFSIYVVGDVAEEAEKDLTLGGVTTTTKTVYVLTSSISSGSSYLIVNGNAAGSYYALANNNGSVAATGVTIKTDSEIGTYIELSDVTDELWTVSGSYRFQNDGDYLYYNSGLDLSSSYTTWSYSSNRLSYRPNKTTYYIGYNNGWTASSTQRNVYFYVPQTITETVDTTVNYTVSASDITHIYDTDSTTAETAALTYTLLANGSEVTFEGGVWSVAVVSDPSHILDMDKSTNETLVFTGTTGSAKVRVYYQLDANDDGDVTDDDDYKVWTTINVETKGTYYSLDLTETVATQVTISEAEFNAGTYYTKDADGVFHVATEYASGTTYYTLSGGESITEPVALKKVQVNDTFSVWAVIKEHTSENPDGVDLGDLDDSRIKWSITGDNIATVNVNTGVVTFNGEKGTVQLTATYVDEDGTTLASDTITISASPNSGVVPDDGTDDFPEYPNEGAIRFDKTATAVGNFSETGMAMVELSMTGVPYTTGSEIDVVVMLDMTGSMSSNGIAAAEAAAKAFVKTIVQNEDGTYNKNRVSAYQFNSSGVSTYFDLQTISSDTELTTAQNKIVGSQASGGTPFDTAAKYCHDVLAAAKTDGTGNDRKQFCVFMSDGGPTAYRATYDNANGYLDITNSGSGTTAITTYFSGYSSGTASDWEFTLPTEYYTDDMKADGVTVYTVGLLLQNVPNNPSPYSSMNDIASVYDSATDTLTTEGNHYWFTSRVLKQMASDEDKYIDIFTVANADNAVAKFESIAMSIKEAATDVKVEDKIGSNYSVNFSIPGYGTSGAVSSDALDGLTEFYIQVVGYTLNKTTHEREGNPTVLENFTFNPDGTLKSHTIGGTACGDCDHVETDNDGAITAIDGTYFDYLSDETGEYLTWTADKLDTTELALQYFAHLDDSTGLEEGQEAIPAGTYYTNEYATLTYTNYKGVECEQEFPVPQMTWNGAQVSYVFYLVNSDGEPVNRAGRVIPFAEAQYVTDVFTHSVVWNDLEQAAGLEAKYLAEQKVPGIYSLYDDDAYYSIHVYEDESEVNLNNHFIIAGDVTDAESTDVGRTNAKTTYVFNNKSDATKYNTVGTYVANDGDDSTDTTTYLCKGEGTVTATIAQVTVSEENFPKSAYYTKNSDGNYILAKLYSATDTYYTITAASYTAVTGETHWTPGGNDSTTGGVVLNGHVYYIDENNAVYTIVQKSNGTEVREGFDFSNTTVAFAVVWNRTLAEDTVVVDYGLDVDVDVSINDMIETKLVGVRNDAPSGININDGRYDNANPTKTAEITVGDDGHVIGVATVKNNDVINFSMRGEKAKKNAMLFNKPAVVYYETDFTWVENNSYKTQQMYSSLTVVPATNVYYEDEYVTLTTYTRADKNSEYQAKSGWDENSTSISTTQKVDRPGMLQNMDENWDANNVYGFDQAYANSATYSLDSVAKIGVNQNKYGTASFDFYGTGFDVISSTSSNTGSLVVTVTHVDASGNTVTDKNLLVNTYYGYELTYQYSFYKYVKDADGKGNPGWLYKGHDYSPGFAQRVDELPDNPEVSNQLYAIYGPYWEPAADDDTAEGLYQVPVMKVTDLPYGKYNVTITAAYNRMLDIGGDGSYDLYLDGIRIYNPIDPDEVDNITVNAGTETESTVGGIYVDDGEGYAVYKELRNIILEKDSLGAEYDETIGVLFIDHNPDGTNSISDYRSYGPNNEVYLAKDQSVAFILDASEFQGKLHDVQIAMKNANETDTDAYAELSIYTLNEDGSYDKASSVGKITAGSTASDRYYSIGDIKGVSKTGETIMSITNAGEDGILSITNVKFTLTEALGDNNSGTDSVLTMTSAVADGILKAMNAKQAEVEPEEILDANLNVSVNKSSVKVGGKVQVKVTTSSDVASLTVNGEEITKYSTNKKTGERTWSTKVTAEEAGELTIEVVAYSKDGKALDSSDLTIEVTGKKNGNVNKSVGQVLANLFG